MKVANQTLIESKTMLSSETAPEALNNLRAMAQAMFERRMMRRVHLPAPLFAEYAWDILLVLFACDEAQSGLNVTSVAERVSSPVTTAARWIDYLEQRRLIDRRVNAVDRREVLLSLTEDGQQALMSYFGALTKDRIVKQTSPE